MKPAPKHAAIALLAVMTGVAAVAAWLQWPRRVDLKVGELQAVYHAHAGGHTIAFMLTREVSRDHGPATLRLKTGAGEITVPTQYNYDTLQDEAAAT